MSNATTPVPQEGTLNAVWWHLNQLCDGDGNQVLDTAAESIEAAANALCDNKPEHPDVVARLLDGAARAVREAQGHIAEACIDLGDVTHA